MYRIGLTALSMVDVKVESAGNMRLMVQPRAVSRNFNSQVIQQIGRKYNIWRGHFLFDTAIEEQQLRDYYNARTVYFDDNTAGGTSLPTLCYWSGDYNAIFEDPGKTIGYVEFILEEVVAYE